MTRGNVVDFATVTIDLQRRADEFVRRALGRPGERRGDASYSPLLCEVFDRGKTIPRGLFGSMVRLTFPVDHRTRDAIVDLAVVLETMREKSGQLADSDFRSHRAEYGAARRGIDACRAVILSLDQELLNDTPRRWRRHQVAPAPADHTAAVGLIDVAWTTTYRFRASIPEAELLASSSNNDDSDNHTSDSRLDPTSLTGTVTGGFDAVLARYEHPDRSHRDSVSRQWQR